MPIVQMVLGLGVVGLALRISGIYGVVSFAVTRRTREMGIRIAMGATDADIMREVIWSNAGPVAAGIASDLALAGIGARAVVRMFASTPVRLDASDPTVYAAVILLLSTAAVAAMIGPARRAAAADPIHALRQE